MSITQAGKYSSFSIKEDKVAAYLNSFRYDPVLVGIALNTFKFK